MPQATTIKFNFKSRVIKDESGATIGRTKKQPSLEAAIPTLAAVEIQEVLDTPDTAVAKLIISAVAQCVIDAARDQFDEIIEGFGDDESKTVNAGMLDYSKLTVDYIASIPPSTRGSTALTDEDWKLFYEDYLVTMVKATGKEESRIKNHIALFSKPQKAKTNKPVLGVLVEQLEVYMASSGNLEENAVCAERALSKFKKWLAEPEQVVNTNLL